MPYSVPTGNFTAGYIPFLPTGHTLVTRRLSNVDIDWGGQQHRLSQRLNFITSARSLDFNKRFATLVK